MPDPRGAARRRELRRLARTHHPDVGGDLEAYLAAVADLENRAAAAAASSDPVEVRRARLLRRLARRLRRRVRARVAERRRRRREAVDERLGASRAAPSATERPVRGAQRRSRGR